MPAAAAGLLIAGASATTGDTRSPGRPGSFAAREPIVISGPGRVAGPGPRSAAGRFLRLYAAAACRPLTVAERAELRADSASEVAALLLEQPPERRLRAGRVASMALSDPLGGTARASGLVGFSTSEERVGLTLARYPDGRWRVTAIQPGPAHALPRGTKAARPF